MTGGLMGSVSSVPSRVTPSLTARGGEAEPTRFDAIKDPVLRAAVMRAYRAWAWTQT